jgi:hypothetical protein
MTVPLSEDRMVHGRAVRVELPGQLARVGVLGDRRVGPDVAHQHGHDHALGLADALPATAELLGEPAGQQPGQRLALLLAVDDGLVQQPEPVQRRRVPGRDTRGQLDEDRLHLGADRLRGNPPGHGDRLDRLALGDHAEQLLLGGGEPAGRGDRPDQRLDDRGIQRRAAGGHRADGVRQLVALGDAVLQQVAIAARALGQHRDRVLRVVVLRQHHDPGPRVALAHLFRRVDALAVKRRRHPDVGDQDLRLDGRRPADHLVVVGGHADHPQVGVPLDERADSLAQDQVVVCEEDVDGAFPRRRNVLHESVLARFGP